MFKFILGVIIGYAIVVIYGPDIAGDVWNTIINLMREVVNKNV
tara:strand:+ start:164 stop:292 length:129 start_codon:yes stop_codon:yes gene_type:complete